VIRIRRISVHDELYRQECALREEVLLRPLGLDLARFLAEFPGVEERAEHFVATVEVSGQERVVGCVELLANEPREGAGRVMQMAVDRQRQGEGVGRRLIVAAEVRAFGELGLGELFCHSQEGAVGFYRKLGWDEDSGSFLEAGIPHRRMAIRHPYAENDPD
jgi:predicted GNAT family N-acyltransferase